MKKVFTIITAVFCGFAAIAQDIHYTQFYNAPLITNPAMTGLTKGSYRVGIIYRNQWFSGVSSGFLNSPYQTPSVFCDVPIRIKNDILGVGAYFLYDRAGAGSLTTYQAEASVSYIKALGRNGNHQLSAGLQIGYSQAQYNMNAAQFASQFQGNEFNANLNTGINMTPSKGYLNLNAGLLYYGKITPNIDIYVGGALSNTTTPKVNIVNNTDVKNLPMKWTANGGLDFKLKTKAINQYHILPSALFMRQSTADQLNIGLGFGVDFSEKSTLTVGVYDRVNNITNKFVASDAVIAYAGFEFSGFKLGISYDFTTSTWRNAKPAVGALELSLMYIGKSKEYPERKILYCPRF